MFNDHHTKLFYQHGLLHDLFTKFIIYNTKVYESANQMCNLYCRQVPPTDESRILLKCRQIEIGK